MAVPAATPPAAIDRFLRILGGLDIPVWDSFDDFEHVLTLAQQSDAPGPLALLRSTAISPLFLQHPLRLYALAARLKWVEEMKIASMFTLALHIYDDHHRPLLQRLPAKELLDLLFLHRSRRDRFKYLLDSEATFNAGNSQPYYCPACATQLDNQPWQALKFRMVLELDKRPLGDTLLDMLDEWQEAVACWNACCSTKECGRPYYDKMATLREIRACLEQLPSSV
ncbi:hypothetical protein APHAL10511_007724 [Amanita phalloides]|nr:hypothetical protein APHAL10511_007724 [Amanita phalloides]